MIPYQYSNLSLDPKRREIRLMKLVAGTGFDPETDTLCFILSNVCLDDSPTYRALSYVWGDLQDTRTAKVDDRDFRISNNLDSALRHLYAQNGDYALWIDAICINQQDNEEKSCQIGLMNDIYAQAELVIAWLGTAADDSEVAMECLRKLGHEAISIGLQDSFLHFELDLEEHSETQSAKLARLPHAKQAGQQNFGPLISLKKDILRLTITGGEKLPIPEAVIVTLLNRPWFQRAWVLQEIVMAKSASFVCGDEWISVDTFRAAYVLLHLYKEELLGRRIGDFDTCVGATTSATIRLCNVVGKFMDYAHRFLTIRMAQRYRGVGLIFLLERTSPLTKRHYLNCSDPRDRVYSLLGLVRKDQDIRIRPDYNKPYSLVYIEVAEELLRVNGPMLLSMRLFPGARQGLPTWVADWSMKRTGDYSLLSRFSNHGRPLFSASKSTNFVYQVRHEQKGMAKLIVSGIYVDTITETMSKNVTDSFVNCFSSDQGDGTIYTKEKDDDDSIRATSHFLNSLDRFSEMAKAYPSASIRKEAAWRTPIADIFLVKTAISESVPDVAMNWVRANEDLNRMSSTKAIYELCLYGACTTEQEFNFFDNVAVSQKLFAEDGPFGLAGKSFISDFENCRPRKENLSKLVDRIAETCTALINVILHGARGPCDDETSAMIESGAETARDFLQIGKEFLYSWLEDYIDTPEIEAEVEEVQKNMISLHTQHTLEMASTLDGRRIFLTSNGYLGLGPTEVEPGDVVVIIMGARVPFVLRKAQGQTFMLIGESYVHGIMDGEMVEDSKVLNFEII